MRHLPTLVAKAKKSSADDDMEIIRSLYREIIQDKKKSASERMKAAEDLRKTLDPVNNKDPVSPSGKPKPRKAKSNGISRKISLN